MVEEQIRDLLLLRLKKLGYHLIRVKLISANSKKTLQIMAERIKDKKMDIEDCVFLSKHISTFLEVDDPISSSYLLEVSSGGVSRPLTIVDDYESFKYNKAKIVLKEKFLGKKTYKGFLKGVDKEGKILLETENHEIKFNFFEIEKANIDPNWVMENN
jgi:ribosome maturation factor RimP